MKKGYKTRRTWSKQLPVMSVLLVSAILYAIAFMSRGVEVTQVSVDDGGIWVTNQDRKLVGHLNYDARMLDGMVSVKSASFDIGQAGGDVTLGEVGTRTVSPVPWFARVRCRSSRCAGIAARVAWRQAGSVGHCYCASRAVGGGNDE